ncbi:MAG: MaoC family dehydratase N-terminal domain-containing protein [Neomegalonema sp.]|nr:MaoC family dehydratase N-terminal domain-containing protein [Neomegalonema sp.]
MSAASPSLPAASDDPAVLRQWIGRREEATCTLDEAAVAGFEAIFATGQGAGALGLHWTLFTPCPPLAMLGPDGHPPRGGFLPPVSLPRRMWAGGALEFHDALRLGDALTRRSVIRDVVFKQGRSSALVFVTVEHELTTGRGPAISERQDIVYRPAATGPVSLPPADPDRARGEVLAQIEPSAPLLFRYSALTCNAHRIHYDLPYAMQEEGYPGLVVHGPMQASVLMQAIARKSDAPLRRFSYRGLCPLIGGAAPFSICARGGEVWTEDEAGRVCMLAQITLAQVSLAQVSPAQVNEALPGAQPEGGR